MEVFEIIKNRRIELGLTMKDVADAVGVSEGTVSRWESGDIANMRRDRIHALSKVLSIDPAIILGIEDSTANRTVTDEDIKFALFGGDGEITDEMYEEVKRFAAYVKERQKKG